MAQARARAQSCRRHPARNRAPAATECGNAASQQQRRREERPPAYAAAPISAPTIAVFLVAVPAAARASFRRHRCLFAIVRLGEGLSLTGRLSEPAMDRAVEALAVWCRQAADAGAWQGPRLIATEAWPLGRKRRRLHRPGCASGQGLDLEIHRPSDRSAAGGVRLRLAGGTARHEAWCCSTSAAARPRSRSFGSDARFSVGHGFANNIAAWTSLPGRRGWSLRPSAMVGATSRRRSSRPWWADVGAMLAGFRGPQPAEWKSSMAAGSTCLAPPARLTTLRRRPSRARPLRPRRVDGLWMDRANVDAMIERRARLVL